jgi:hypothetical protein
MPASRVSHFTDEGWVRGCLTGGGFLAYLSSQRSPSLLQVPRWVLSTDVGLDVFQEMGCHKDLFQVVLLGLVMSDLPNHVSVPSTHIPLPR